METLARILVVFLACTAIVAEADDTAAGAHILQMDSDFPIEKIDIEGVTLHPLSELETTSELLPLPVRNRILEKSGLAAFVKDWGAVELDLLALRCEKHEPRRVQARYKNRIPLEAIESYQTLSRKYRRERDRK